MVLKFKNRRAVSAVVVEILLVAIVVVSSVLVYVWVTNFASTTSGKAEKNLLIHGVVFRVEDSTRKIDVYIQNAGSGSLEVSAIFIDNVLYNDEATGIPATLNEGEIGKITVNFNWVNSGEYTIKITCKDGTTAEGFYIAT